MDTGPGADLVVSRLPVTVQNASGRDLLVPIADRSLPAGVAATSRRTEKPNLAHEATYVGQSLVGSRTWTADGRFVEIGFDAQGGTVRDTYLGDRLLLSESWRSTGGYQRAVTDVDGTRLRETFEKACSGSRNASRTADRPRRPGTGADTRSATQSTTATSSPKRSGTARAGIS